MKQPRPYPVYAVTPKAERSLTAGHPWVYGEEIIREPETAPENGALVDVVSRRGSYLGTGLLSLHSKIRIRLLSRSANDRFDEAFWRRRLEYAWAYRRTVMGPEDLDCCRIVFGEADQLPGLTVDRFHDILVTQTMSYGMELRKDVIFPALAEVLRADGQEIRGIYERNDVPLREREGLAEGKGWYRLPGEEPPAETRTLIRENGVAYEVDFENGQKTGFFLDQKYNRAAAARIAPGKSVLDCFTHTGSFGLNCAKAGAKRVHSVDVSETAIACAKENAARNGLSVEYEVANVFDLLPSLTPGEYDYIILDPPAFTKSGKTVKNAERGYKEINYRAMKLLPRGGYLATCSCSHFMSEERFIQMLREAAHDAHVELRQIEARQQAPDHPILWNVPETNYLKFFLFQVV